MDMWSVLPIGKYGPPYKRVRDTKKNIDCSIVQLLLFGFISTILVGQSHAYKAGTLEGNTTYPESSLLFPTKIKFINSSWLVSPLIINGVLVEYCAPVCLPEQKSSPLASSPMNINCIWRIVKSELTLAQLRRLKVSDAELRCDKVWHRDSRRTNPFCMITVSKGALCAYDTLRNCELRVALASSDERINRHVAVRSPREMSSPEQITGVISYLYMSVQWSVVMLCLFLLYSAYQRCGLIGAIVLIIGMIGGVISSEIRIVEAETYTAHFIVS